MYRLQTELTARWHLADTGKHAGAGSCSFEPLNQVNATMNAYHWYPPRINNPETLRNMGRQEDKSYTTPAIANLSA
jgi:hypothetical protein